jgi:hypothetical protein
MPELSETPELVTLTEFITELESYWMRLHSIQRTVEDLHRNLRYKITGDQKLEDPKPTPDPDDKESVSNLNEIVGAYRRTIYTIEKITSELNQLV